MTTFTRYIPILFTIALTIVATTTMIFGQSTPYCLPNTVLGSTVNTWDWRTIQYDAYLENGGARKLTSPFRLINNSLPVNTQYIAVTTSEIDYQPTNGWELLYKNLGTKQRPVSNASFALYNRYTGIIRALFYIQNSQEQFNAATLSIRPYRSPEIPKGSGIFSLNNTPISPLETFRPSQNSIYTQTNLMTTSGAWIVLDFPTAFDPCVCTNTSIIEFAPTLQSITSINLILEGTGKSEAIYSKGSGSNNAIDVAGRISDGFIGAAKRYKDYNDLVGFDDKNKGIGALKFLSDFKFLPAVGGVIDLLDFFITGKKTSPMLIGYNSNYSFSGNGTLNFQQSDKTVGILTPGSKSPTSQSLQSLIPIYNNPLGVFNLMSKPKINRFSKQTGGIYGQCDKDISYTKAYQLDLESIKYAVNTAAGLQGEPLSIQAALRFRSCGNYRDIISKQLTPQASTPGVYYSPLMDLDCLGDYTITLNAYERAYYNSHYNECETENVGGFCSKVDLLLLVALKRKDGSVGQEIVTSMLFEADIVDKTATVFPVNKYVGKTVAQINATCPQRTINPVDRAFTASFCSSSTKYNPVFITKDVGASSAIVDFDNYVPESDFQDNSDLDNTITVVPNPTTDFLLVKFGGNSQITGNIVVTDLLGRRLKSEQFTNQISHTIDLSDLVSGTYVVSLFDESFRMLSSRTVLKQ